QLQQIAQRLRLERAPACEDLEQHEAQRVDVGLDGRRRHGLKAVPYDRSWGKLLGRHVLRRARAHDVGIAGGDSVSCTLPKGKAEIGYADVALAVEHDVGRLELAVPHGAI